MGIPFDKDAFIHLMENWYRKPGRAMQAVHPRDLLRSVLALCDYEGLQPCMTPELIDEACRCYFVE
jgi:hypothetical protein